MILLQTNYEIFMLVAEEMSISKAAKRAFVTQQCVSDHIKRLEKQLNIKLFTRHPRFTLTSAGEIMLKTLRNIHVLESNMFTNIHQLSTGEVGHFIVGISASRAQVILPKVLPIFYQYYPKIKISFFMEDTIILEEKLIRGEIDLFIGVNAHKKEEFQIIPLCYDEICLIVTDSLLEEYLGNQSSILKNNSVDLAEFSHIPFSESFKTGAINKVVQDYLDVNNIQLNTIYSISDVDTQISLCATGLCASLCPKMFIDRIKEYNSCSTSSHNILIFPLRDLNKNLRIEVIHHENITQPSYIEKFIEILQEQVKTFDSY